MEQTSITFSAVIPAALKKQLEQWARAEDRTVSAELRRILTEEASRRAGQQQQTIKAN